MKIVVGSDGSECSRIALELTGNLCLPTGSAIHLVTAVWPRSAGVALGVERRSAEWAKLRDNLAAAAALVRSPSRVVDYSIETGRPSVVICDVASSIDADLIVIAGQGAGAAPLTPLGSVAAEVVGDADRPVLVARRCDVRNVVLAVDGSECAKVAVDVVNRSSMFASSHIEVLSVAEPKHVWRRLGVPRNEDERRDGEPIALAPDPERQEIADSVVRVLSALGREAEAFVRKGDPAAELTRFADSRGTDLIVVGRRGNTSVRRFPLGSVSRDVLFRASCSVLIVPNRIDADWIYQD